MGKNKQHNTRHWRHPFGRGRDGGEQGAGGCGHRHGRLRHRHRHVRDPHEHIRVSQVCGGAGLQLPRCSVVLGIGIGTVYFIFLISTHTVDYDIKYNDTYY